MIRLLDNTIDYTVLANANWFHLLLIVEIFKITISNVFDYVNRAIKWNVLLTLYN